MKFNKRFAIIAAVLALAMFATACSFSASTANIQDAIMTNTIDSEGKPGEEVVSFPADAAMLYVSAQLRNAPDNTQVKFSWTYVTGDQLIDEITVDSGNISDRYIYSNLEPTALLPEGDYMVQIYIDERTEPDATVKFVVVGAEAKAAATDGAYIEDAHMTSAIDAESKPVDTITVVPTEGTWYVSSILRNTQPDTIVHYTWYDTNGNVVDTYDLNPEGATDVYIFGSFALASMAPEGTYRVEITIDDATTPAATVDFEASNDAVNNSVATAGFTLYSQEAGGYSFEYPSDWMLQEFPDQMIAFVYPDAYSVAGEDDLNTVYVVANKGTGAGYTIDTLLQGWVDETNAEGIENYKYIAQSVDTINGKDIASFSYSWTRGDYKLYTVDALLLNGSDFYVLELTVEQSVYDALYPLFEHMAISFEILN